MLRRVIFLSRKVIAVCNCELQRERLFLQLEKKCIRFPGGSVVKNPPADAGDPWSRKIPNVTEQLSPCATAIEPVHPRACAPQQEKPPQWATGEYPLLTATRKKPAQQQKPGTAKNK